MPAVTFPPPVPDVPALLAPASAATAGPALCEVTPAAPPSLAARLTTGGCWLLAVLSVFGGALSMASPPSSGESAVGAARPVAQAGVRPR